MDSILDQIRDLSQRSDEAGQLRIQKALRDIQTELQSPKDLLMDLANSFVLIGTIRLGADLGLFRHFASQKEPLTVSQLADLTGASPQLLERFLRYLASTNIIKEVAANQYQANTTTFVLADPKGDAMIYHGFDNHAPTVMAMPAFFAENNYQDIDSVLKTPFQKAHNTTLSSFEWYVKNPEHFENLQKVMTSLEGVEWTVGFNHFESEAKKIPSSLPVSSEKPFFVDVGGGHGHQCIQLGKKYPNLLGRLVLQDLPAAVNKLAPIEGVKAVAHDFFEEQPITDAKFYYLRRIMHDWPDRECSNILRNIASAMSAESRILIDEVVLPDTGAHWQATMADITMMIGLGGKERTAQQWQALADLSGLQIELIHTYTASTYTSVIVMALK
ncbi:S-adenosyl-L-methionine-dependent methyltransferase [Penicillium macrosclerotiorum]|uniref:S-adenosyl-L-methionine-dependent methyltransferase n=1 Tax=Penicillium macrosclerotiorum TaxID=303699 RepID=UPI002546B914|nr:S-adenosyl-L-methionine-dependent methyltransferase [Penicillium macrosclerotiorum]KAJ5669145.1 S-adenosyl-L-methionine-dependent methyltransferase [Penicillium macrosclerotiorum]